MKLKNLPSKKSIYKKQFIENWNFYLDFPVMLQCGEHEIPNYDPIKGVSGKYSFCCLENGLMIPTKEIYLVKRALEGKKSINLQIKLWAEDLGILLMPDELQTYCKDMPRWIFIATIEQATKRIIKEIGFVPSFLRNFNYTNI